MPIAKLCKCLLALAFISAPAGAQLFTDEEALANWREGDFEMPAAPQDAALGAFFVSSASPNRFFIDRDTLAVDPDGVVRYVLVVRTPGGAENVTFEGIRCATHERRIYASGRSDGTWSPARNSRWEPIVNNSYNRVAAALAREYFCDGPAPPRNRAEVLRRLRGGAGSGIDAVLR